MDRYGSLEGHANGWRLEFTRRLAHPPDKVWRALTEPEHLEAWFPTEIRGDRAEGAHLHFVFRHGEGPAMDGTMIHFDPPRLLEYRWGDESLRFELQPQGDGTVLVFVNSFVELGKAARDGAGWHLCLDLLATRLGAEERRNEGFPATWQQVHPTYVARFGPAAATIGPPRSMTDTG